MPYDYKDLEESLEREPDVDVLVVEDDRGPTWGIEVKFTDDADSTKDRVRGLVETVHGKADYEPHADDPNQWSIAGAK